MKPVLIVEDEAIMRESLRDWLKDAGYDVETVERGEDALQKIGEIDFGLMLLDMKLPGKNGLQVLKEAKILRPQLKGIILTAYPTVETAVEAMKIGAVDYLVKPVDPNALETLIEETLGPIQIEIRPIVPVEAVPVKEVEKIKNLLCTKFHRLCWLCHVSGYSDLCNLLQTGKCVYHEAQQESKNLLKQRAANRAGQESNI